MPVSVKVYYGKGQSQEIRRFIFRPDDPANRVGIYRNLLQRIKEVYNGLHLTEFNLCWKDDDADYVVFSSDDELKVALNNNTDNTLKIYIKDKDRPLPQDHVSTSAATMLGHPFYGQFPKSYGRSPETTRKKRSDFRSTSRPRSHHCNDTGDQSNHQFHRNKSPHSNTIPFAHTNNFQNHEFFVHAPHEPVDSSGAEFHSAESPMATTVPIPTSTNVPHTSFMQVPLSRSPGNTTIHATSSPRHQDNNTKSSTEKLTMRFLCSECRRDEAHRGIWYQCTVCANYVICSTCEHRGIHDLHAMVRISTSSGYITSSAADDVPSNS